MLRHSLPWSAAVPSFLTFALDERTEPPGAPQRQRPRWARKSARECSAAASLGQKIGQ
ncbi:hypothetical protein EMIHUDRAFT_246907 [Emiliania huxleyi CCMP1516]|uniref:Uncharacterized protein n=2 Tax=Emiliania huxleyi TaxID=2903 RepID=A0A0D3IQ28_EMIH1|nr:hypothetical protein EMIHUDRAFT_246907 [Emiliania huxleyi CCMP1516]EOD13363.1 hypothetical protein EMIHUDRAFT_246907 [Emiliania huxleyi CCMP1516]|eukprot:XP_005765792.1 hypothetical protein EMIHUDRAFT_246907 [Emiliania huxleyi CCMP1516]